MSEQAVASRGAEGAAEPELLQVYWRPGCPFCTRLLGAIDGAGIAVRLHNIWEDEDARAFVRDHNSGNETVPTVALGEIVLVNPHPRVLLDALAARHSPDAAAAPPSGGDAGG